MIPLNEDSIISNEEYIYRLTSKLLFAYRCIEKLKNKHISYDKIPCANCKEENYFELMELWGDTCFCIKCSMIMEKDIRTSGVN